MKIAIPVDQINGLASEIAPNLRAAPALLIIDTADNTISSVDTRSGMCGSFPAGVDTIICAGGVGHGMYNGFMAKGIRLYHSDHTTAGQALEAYNANQLTEIKDVPCCGGGHHHDHGHGHAEQGCCHGSHHHETEEQGHCCGNH